MPSDLEHEIERLKSGVGPDSRDVDELLSMLSANLDDEPRARVVEALVSLGDPRAVDALIVALNDRNSWERENAVVALGDLGDDRAVEPLFRMARDDAWRPFRIRAGESLAKLGDERGVLLVAKNLRGDEAKFAAEVLGRLGDRRAVEPLARCLRRTGSAAGDVVSGDWDLRIAVANALAALGDSRGMQMLRADLKNPWLLERSAQALGNWGDPAACGALAAAMPPARRGGTREASLQSRRRLAAAEALAKLGDARGLDALQADLQDDALGREERARAAEILGSVGGQGQIGVLSSALEDRFESVRTAASEALKEITRRLERGETAQEGPRDGSEIASDRAGFDPLAAYVRQSQARRTEIHDQVGATRHDSFMRWIPATAIPRLWSRRARLVIACVGAAAVVVASASVASESVRNVVGQVIAFAFGLCMMASFLYIPFVLFEMAKSREATRKDFNGLAAALGVALLSMGIVYAGLALSGELPP